MVNLFPRRRAMIRAFAILVGAAAVVVPATAALAAPTFKVPFPCGQTWSGQTRSDHSPANAIDFNRTNDDGDPVVASASGTVDRVTDLGNTSYGRYVRIDHGGGYTTYYAHLSRFNVSVGQTVRYGQVIGYVGTTGGSTGPHLHYEQRSGGTAVKINFNGTQALYWGTKNYTSDNGCSSGAGSGTVNTSGTPLTVRSGPGTGYDPVGTVADGTRVTIACQTTGTTVDGTYGTSNIWDRIGTGRYIADAYVLTGYDGYIPGVPRC
jgi:murein DD-endopeptidase MepM/ murein hydrolase activator NlpD